MPIYQAVVLAIVQALTEFLPISSTAHLVLIPWLFGWKDGGLTFDVALHAGTLFAILLYFWRTWIQIIRAALGGKVVRFSEVSDDQRDLTPEEQSRERKLLWYMIAATIPAALAGAVLEKKIETTFRAPALVASMLIIVAVIMWLAERASKFGLKGVGDEVFPKFTYNYPGNGINSPSDGQSVFDDNVFQYDDAVSSIRILDRNRHEGADLPHAGFLREGNNRPSRSKAAETSDEIAPVHVEGLSG